MFPALEGSVLVFFFEVFAIFNQGPPSSTRLVTHDTVPSLKPTLLLLWPEAARD